MPLIEGALINGAAAGFTLDVVISSLVFWAFMLSQKEKGPAPLRFIVLNLFVGLSCLAGLFVGSPESICARIVDREVGPDVSTGRCLLSRRHAARWPAQGSKAFQCRIR